MDGRHDRPVFSERWLQRVMLLAAGVFLVYFFVPRADGLRSMWDMMWGAVTNVPPFFADIVDYFASVPAGHLGASLLVGGLFGGVTTALVAHSGNGVGRVPRTVLQRVRVGPTAAGFAVGALVGAVGAQILLYPTQHCTYDPAIAGAQFRMGLLVTWLSALILLVPLWTLLRRAPGGRRERLAGHFKNPALPYVFLLPTLAILVMFLYYPAVQIMTLSLRRKIFPLPQERFVCLENYTSLAEDTVYRNSFSTTLFITLFVVLFSLSVALVIGVLASQKVKGASIYRTLLIWPYAISPVVTAVIFLTMFREGGSGLLNWALTETLGTSVRWLTDKDIAPWVIVAAAVWNLLGFNILFYVAGLQNIPQDLLEAASLDGANRFIRFWRITFPLLSPFTFFLLVTNITYSFYGIYGVVDTLTPQGGPRFGPGGESGATNVLIFKLYKDAFDTGAPAGLGAAQALILFLMVAGLTVLQFRFIERRVTYEG